MGGARPEATTSNGLILDFTGLFAKEPVEEAESPQNGLTEPQKAAGDSKSLSEQKGALNGLVESENAEQAPGLLFESRIAREDHERSLAIYREYQENRIKSGQLQTEILKGIAAGEDIYSLFLKAVKTISTLTGSEAFYAQARLDTLCIYGRGLNEKPPLSIELQDTIERILKLSNAAAGVQNEPEAWKRIQWAIKAHEEKAKDLERQIAQAEKGKATA